MKQTNFNLNHSEISKIGSKYLIYGSQLITLGADELFIKPRELKKLGTDYIVTVFTPVNFSDSIMGAIHRIPLFCKKLRPYEIENLNNRTIRELSDAKDNLADLYSMFINCERAKARLGDNIRKLQEIIAGK